MTNVAHITAKRAVHVPAPRAMTSAQKAAVIVRFLMTEGAQLSLTALPDHLQTELTRTMGGLGRIDRTTLVSVVEEFAAELESTGLTFPQGISGALTALDGQISPSASDQLRKLNGFTAQDAWDRLKALDQDTLLDIMMTESTEIAAVLLSKLDVPKAAEILGKMPGERAHRITYAISQTADVAPNAVDRIGLSLTRQLDSIPDKAFKNAPGDRVGAILNSSNSTTRNALLDGLDDSDQAFANQVRKAIFTFKHIAERLDPRDVPQVLRMVSNDQLIIAMSFATNDADATSAEFILNNISKRMAEQLREEIADAPVVDDVTGEKAMSQVVEAIQSLSETGEILLVQSSDA